MRDDGTVVAVDDGMGIHQVALPPVGGEGHRFVIGEALGRGTSSVVYRARSLSHGGDVALKLLHPRLAHRSSACALLAREARLTARIGSSRVPAVLDTMSWSSTSFIAMERLRGSTLAERMAQRGALSVNEFTRLLDGMCRALRDVHRAGCAHLDVKPSNIFIAPRETIKLIDFGAACQHGESDTLTGTPAYMSPERLCGGGPVDATSDLWSIGVVAFECLTGRRAFSGISVPQVAAQVMHGHIPAITELAPHLAGSQVDDWLRRALNRDRRRRFPSARAVFDGFVDALR